MSQILAQPVAQLKPGGGWCCLTALPPADPCYPRNPRLLAAALPGTHRVVAPNIEPAAKDHKGHKETPDPTGSPLRSLRSFAAIQASTSVSLQNPNLWSAWIGITVPLEKLRDLLPK